MRLNKYLGICWLSLGLLMMGCSTTKSKDDQSKFKKLYHNTTSKYNGFFNAQEIMQLTLMEMDEMHQENYNKVLPVFNYVEIDNPKAVTPELDRAIEKVITVATIHDLSNYVDDCYVLMGQAQYLKQDYASAEETFQFFEEEFDPKNPYGREYTKAKRENKSSKDRKKETEAKRKEAQKERKEEQKEREKEREEAQKKREEEQKAREEEKKKRQKDAKKKGRKKGSKTRTKKTEDSTPKTAKKSAEEKAADKAAEKAAKEEQEEKEEYEKQKAKLKEAAEEQKRRENRPQGEGGVFKNKTAYYQGLYWLARTYIERDRFSAANYLLDRLTSTEPLDEAVSSKLPAARAHLYLRSGENAAALVALDEAFNLEEDKKLKARYAFIRAQLYEEDNRVNLAYDEYKKAKKYSPEYEMKFNANLNELKLAYKTGNIDRDKVYSKLDGMLKEVKNEEFADQIFFTMAQVKLDEGDVAGAIEDFGYALESSGGNQNVKLEAYYKLAELLYAQGYYSEAKKNYDSTLELMPLGDERYKHVERLANSLKDIASNIQIVELQDSLLTLSNKSDAELEQIAIDNLTRMKAEAEASGKQTPERQSSIIPRNSPLGSGRSSFFAYNQLALNKGKIEFRKAWGDRVMEDNWRRSLRTDVGTALAEEEIIEEEEGFSQEEIDDFLRSVPTSESQQRSANIKIQNALLSLGIQFRERLRNYEKSAEALERLVNEYPNFEKRDEALYYLYLSQDDAGNPSGAQMALNKLKSEFPDSKFTRLATDPSYAKSLQSGSGSLEEYYSKTYQLFEEGQHEEVLKRISEKSALFKDDDSYDARMNLLQAMAYGSTEGKDRYIKELQALVKRHKGSPEEVRATEILRFLKGDATAFNEILFDESFEKFTLDNQKTHYIFVVLYDQAKNMQSLKLAVKDYNRKYHKKDKLSITSIVLNTENDSQVILVRSFDDKEGAMDYYDGVKKNESEFINKVSSTPVGYEIFAATQKNYREMIKQKDVNAYRTFFEEHYSK